MNATPAYVQHIHGKDPQFLLGKILRLRVYDSNYWKLNCAFLEQDTVVKRMLELQYVGGTFGAYGEPSPFVCILLKMLQVQPPLELVINKLLAQGAHKYVRAVAAFYVRMVASPVTIYTTLEPLRSDNRPLRLRDGSGWAMVHMDDVIHALLNDRHLYDVDFPHLPPRHVVEGRGDLSPIMWPEGVEDEARRRAREIVENVEQGGQDRATDW